MKTRLFLSGLLLAVFSAAVAVPAQAQTVAALQASPNPSLAGSIWLVKVAGEPRTRTLIIAEEAPIAGGALLTARYGMSDEHQTPIAAAIRLVGNKRQLVLTTQAASEIVADEQSNGSFSGTFTPKKGGVKPVSIALASDEDLRIASAAKVLVADPLIPSGVSHWADKPKLFAGDSWRFEFANKRYAKPGCQYQLSIERITGSNVYARAAFPDGCEVSITTALPIGPGTLQKFDLSLNHYHFSSDPYPAFDFPLYVGKAWTKKWQWTLNGWVYNDTVVASVEAFEKVATPAGTFDTYRIRLLRTYNGSKAGSQTQSGTLEDTFWYSPEVKYFVKRTYVDRGWSDITRELVSYSVNGGASVLSSQASVTLPGQTP